VWYRSKTTERYEDTDSEGRSRTRKRVLSEQQSGAPFTLIDDSGTVLVDAGAARVRVDCPQKTLDKFERGSIPWALEFSSRGFGLSSNVTGLRREEWTIGVGETLYVLGAASYRKDSAALTAPDGDDGQLLVSTRTEQQLTASGHRIHMAVRVGACVGVIGGLSLVAVGGALGAGIDRAVVLVLIGAEVLLLSGAVLAVSVAVRSMRARRVLRADTVTQEAGEPRAASAGWFADPTTRHELRYWNGELWTDQVADHGTRAIDPIPRPTVEP
jgi:hypothetical protein